MFEAAMTISYIVSDSENNRKAIAADEGYVLPACDYYQCDIDLEKIQFILGKIGVLKYSKNLPLAKQGFKIRLFGFLTSKF